MSIVEQQPFVPSQPSFVREKPSSRELSRARFLGRIKTCPTSGFGTILRDDKQIIRFNRNELRLRRVLPYTKVSFSIRNSPRGPEAFSITISDS